MTRSLLASGFAATLLVLSGCATVADPGPPPLMLEQIVAMAKEGKDAPTIIGAIQASQTSYDVTASQYAKLSREGVPDAVLDYMQQGQLRYAERMGRREAYRDYWMGYGWYGYGPVWFPRGYYAYHRGYPYYGHW